MGNFSDKYRSIDDHDYPQEDYPIKSAQRYNYTKKFIAYDGEEIEIPKFDKALYEADMMKYRKAKLKMFDMVKQDMFEDCGIQNHPAREIMWQKAWDDGHSSGYKEVFLVLEEISSFLDDALKLCLKKEEKHDGYC